MKLNKKYHFGGILCIIVLFQFASLCARYLQLSMKVIVFITSIQNTQSECSKSLHTLGGCS